MANYRLIFAILFIISIFAAAMLGISNASKNSRIAEAEDLAREARSYLGAIDSDCRAYADEFTKLADCLEDMAVKLENLGDIKEDSYQDFDPETNETGYIILLNDGRSSLNSSKFTLLKNRKVADQGCAIQGMIDPGYTCKLTFNTSCERGDVLEARHEGERAYIKTC